MNHRNRPLYAAVAACFGVVAGQAFATVDLTSSSTSAKFAKELPITSTTTLALTNAANLLDVVMPSISGFAPTTATPLYIKVSLTNGAKFTTNPVIQCSADSAGGDASAYTGSITFGGAGNSTVTFQITATDNGAGATLKMTGASGCRVSGMGITISGAIADVAASATYEYQNGAVSTVSGLAGPYITFVRGVVATADSAVGTVVVDAIGGATRFTGGTNGGTALGILGSVRVLGSGTGVSADGANYLSAGDAIQSANITISGPSVAAGLGLGNSGMFLSNIADCSTKNVLISDSAGSSVTFKATAADLTQLSAASGLTVCINVSGNATQIMTGQLTASLSPFPRTSVTADLSTQNNGLEFVTQNGTTKNAYFINASTSASKISIVRFVNTGGAAGTLRATAFDEAGNVIGNANSLLVSALANNQMATMASADIEAALGFTPASGTAKYRIVVTGNLASFKILNFTRDLTTGAIVLSQGQDD